LPSRESLPGFVHSLHGALQQLRDDQGIALPDFSSSRRLMAFSDYSARDAEWNTAAFLFTPLESMIGFGSKLDDVRRAHRIGDRRQFEYKSLKDKLRWRALPAWLEAFDQLPGVVFVLLVQKEIVAALDGNTGQPSEDLVAFLRDQGFGDWSQTASGSKLAEHALRAVHAVAYWHALLAGPSVELQWLTDNDEIIAGPVRRASVKKLLPNVMQLYCGRPTGCAVATEADANGGDFIHFLSIPDLMAAAVLQHQRGTDTGAMDAIAKAAAVMQWFNEPSSLTKVCLRLSLVDGVVQWTLYRPYFQLAPGIA
jgi:hypothetical protein